jgi:predicted small secreted protein
MRVITFLLLLLCFAFTGCRNTPLDPKWWRWVALPQPSRLLLLLSCFALVACSMGPTTFERTTAVLFYLAKQHLK